VEERRISYGREEHQEISGGKELFSIGRRPGMEESAARDAGDGAAAEQQRRAGDGGGRTAGVGCAPVSGGVGRSRWEEGAVNRRAVGGSRKTDGDFVLSSPGPVAYGGQV
jgi:hypothetical protein